MLLDFDLIDYLGFTPSPEDLSEGVDAMPPRLMAEVLDVSDGYLDGPLLTQQREFLILSAKNDVMETPLTTKTLAAIHTEHFPKNVEYMCYCHNQIHTSGPPEDAIVCAHADCTRKVFHKSCTKKLNVERSSRWFCTACARKMDLLARQTLRELGFTDIPNALAVDELLGREPSSESLSCVTHC